jgi:hypothetical protein
LGVRGSRLVRLGTKGAMRGSLLAHGVSPQLVVLSDGAGPFTIWVHAACWVHAERSLARLIAHNAEHRRVIEPVRQQIGQLYQDLKAEQQNPEPAQAPVLTARFESWCTQRTG